MTYKIKLFKYIVRYIQMHRDTRGAFEYPSRFRLQRLLFLICSVNASKQRHGLLDVFNNFVATPDGPEEFDIERAIRSDEIPGMQFVNNQKLKVFEYDNGEFDDILPEHLREIDEALNKLFERNPRYLLKTAIELSDITKRWGAWIVCFEVGEMFGTKNERITTEDILSSVPVAY